MTTAAADRTGALARRLDTHLGPVAQVVLVTLVALSAFVGLRLALHDGDVTVFVLAGDEVTVPAEAPDGLRVAEGVRGYDGQAFYRLARNPFTRESREFGIEFSPPEYRHQRIAYPALAWVLAAGGREGLTPWSLVVVNLVAGAAMAGLAARLALDAGRSAWLGLVPAAWAGYLIGLSLDLAEVVAGAFLLAALLALRRRRWALAAIALTGGALTRETGLVLVAAVLATAVVTRVRREALPSGSTGHDGGHDPGDLGATDPEPAGQRHLAGRLAVPVWVPVVPVVVFGAWRVLLRWWWDGAPTAGGSSDFLTFPFVRLAQRILDLVREPATLDASHVQLALTLVAVGTVAIALADRRAGLAHERLALLAFVVLFACSPVWNLDVTFLRWAGDSVTAGWLLTLGAGSDRLRLLAATTGALWLLTAALWVPFP